jgi:hypothetical protein
VVLIGNPPEQWSTKMTTSKIALVALVLLATTTVASALTGRYEEYHGRVALECQVIDPDPPLNVRTSPNGRIVGGLNIGDRVITRERQGNWVYVETFEDGPPSGWVFVKYLGNCH